MLEDYSDALQRHLESGIALVGLEHFANASHLLGISAECAIKAILTKNRYPNSAKPLHSHLPWILDTLKTHSLFKNNAKLLARITEAARGLNQWRIAQRYANRTQFLRSTVLAEMEAAKKLRQLKLHFFRGTLL